MEQAVKNKLDIFTQLEYGSNAFQLLDELCR